MRELERRVLLSVLDRKWREHLYEMDYLREGIYLRAYSQRDPLVEYQREGFDMFSAMMDVIKAEAVGFLFNLEVQLEEDEEDVVEEVEEEVIEPMRQPVPAADGHREAPHIRAKGLDRPKQPEHLSYSAPSETGEVDVRGETVTQRRRPVRRRGPQRRVPLRLRQEVQEVPRRPRWPDRPHRPRQRLASRQFADLVAR